MRAPICWASRSALRVPGDVRLHGFDRIELVMHRRSGTGEVVDLIHFEADGFDHVVANQLEPALVQQVGQCCLESR